MEILARGVGRRKEAVAQVQLVKGTGQFIINNIPYHQYLHNNTCSLISVKAPLSIGKNASPVTPLNSKGFDVTSSHSLSDKKVEMKDNLALSTNNSNVSTDLPLDNVLGDIDTIVKVKGGGLIGQAEAIKLGLARAICQLTTTSSSNGNSIDGTNTETGLDNNSVLNGAATPTLSSEIRKQLKDKGYLTQDSRVKERRKYGLKKARKASQYHKR